MNKIKARCTAADSKKGEKQLTSRGQCRGILALDKEIIMIMVEIDGQQQLQQAEVSWCIETV